MEISLVVNGSWEQILSDNASEDRCNVNGEHLIVSWLKGEGLLGSDEG